VHDNLHVYIKLSLFTTKYNFGTTDFLNPSQITANRYEEQHKTASVAGVIVIRLKNGY
jgi:hypothetical protein